jgi:hypothetical protein
MHGNFRFQLCLTAEPYAKPPCRVNLRERNEVGYSERRSDYIVMKVKGDFAA